MTLDAALEARRGRPRHLGASTGFERHTCCLAGHGDVVAEGFTETAGQQVGDKSSLLAASSPGSAFSSRHGTGTPWYWRTDDCGDVMALDCRRIAQAAAHFLFLVRDSVHSG